MSAHGFRFAVEVHGPLEGRTWPDTVRELESLGYSTLFVPDHFDEGLGPITAMATAAVLTTTLKVGALVFDCDYRHPAVLARELASIDAALGGPARGRRGRGLEEARLRPLGHPDGSAEGARRPDDRAHEDPEGAVHRRPNRCRSQGEHYRITDLPGTPRPHTPGGPPFIIGGGQRARAAVRGARSPTSSGVNASIHSGEVDTDAAARRHARAHRREGRLAARRRGRPLRRASRSTPGSRRPRSPTTRPRVADVMGQLFSADP